MEINLNEHEHKDKIINRTITDINYGLYEDQIIIDLSDGSRITITQPNIEGDLIIEYESEE